MEEWGSADFNTREELLAHIDKHRQEGHYIPDNVDKRLHEEIRTQ
jgi:hypothetical protein